MTFFQPKPEKDIFFDSFIRQIKWGHLDLLPNFIELGVDIHKNNDLALKTSIYAGHEDIALYLIKEGCRNSDCVVWAAGAGNKELLIQFLKMGARNDAALIEAAKMGHLEIVQYLHQLGVDIHLAKEAALQWSCQNGHLEVVRYLLKHNCDIHVADNFCLRKSVEGKHLDIAKELIQHGANILKDKRLLYNAVETNFLPMVQLLVSSGIDPNVNNGSAFAVAAFNNYQDIGLYLFEHQTYLKRAKTNFIKLFKDDASLNELHLRWNEFVRIINLKVVHKSLKQNLQNRLESPRPKI